MRPTQHRLVVTVAILPGVFLAILFGWIGVDDILGSREVTRFIRDHREIVARRLSDPKVHAFSLSHDPENHATLLIRFDVEDKATYLLLEEDLNAHWGLRSPARWDTRLRSREDLGNNFGFAAQGIGEVMWFRTLLRIAAVASAICAIAYFVLSRRRGEGRPEPP